MSYFLSTHIISHRSPPISIRLVIADPAIMSYRKKIVFVFSISAVLAALVVTPLFIPAHQYHAAVEQLISENLERDVRISKLKYQIYPLPHIEATNITIISKDIPGEAFIGKAGIWLSITDLVQGKFNIGHVHFNGVATNQAFIEGFIEQYEPTDTSSIIAIKRISASSVSFRTHDNSLFGPFRFDSLFDNNGAFSWLKVSHIDSNLEAKLTLANNKGLKIDLSGNQPQLPVNLPVNIDTLTATAYYQNETLDITKLKFSTLGGEFDSRLKLLHSQQTWSINGHLNASHINLHKISQLLSQPDYAFDMQGNASGEFNFKGQSPSIDQLAKSMQFHGKLFLNDSMITDSDFQLTIDSLTANSQISFNRASFSQVKAQLYGGTAYSDDINLNWAKSWQLTGKLKSQQVGSSRLVDELFGQSAFLAGKLNGNISFNSKTTNGDDLFKQLHIQGNVNFDQPTVTLPNELSKQTHLEGFTSIAFNNLRYTPTTFTTEDLRIKGYDGAINASNLHLAWGDLWSLETSATTDTLDVSSISQELGYKKFAKGHLTSEFTLNTKAKDIEELFDQYNIEGNFGVSKGTVRLAPATATAPSKQFTFDHALAKARLDEDNVIIASLMVHAYNGKINVSDFHLNRKQKDSVYCEIDANDIELESFLRDTLHQQSITGKAGTRAMIAFSGNHQNNSNTFLDKLNAKGAFYINDGIVYNTDIEQAVKAGNGNSDQAGSTQFSEISSKFEIIGDKVELSKFRITSNSLNGKGDITIYPNQNIEGTMDVSLRSTGSLLKMPLNIAGTLDEPKYTLTGGALVGSAIGTSVLGPGFGTFIGLQTGKIFTGIGNLFTSKKR